MRRLELLALGWLITGSQAAMAGLDVLVTLDNGEFNTPLYTPRWNGAWAQPSAAQEIAISVARVAGENPQVYTYLPPGAVHGRPGAPFQVQPRRADCEGPAAQAGDPCFCSTADRCWQDLGPNYHPDASTSLYLTAAALREEHTRPRIEVHFSDLFEEEPAAADNTRDLDRCVTAEGTRKAVAGLFQLAGGQALDHAAVGVLRVRAEAPPPGPHRGFTYDLVQRGAGACWTGVKGGEWGWSRRSYDMSLAVLVLGIDTADRGGEVMSFLDGLSAQLASEALSVELVTLRQPPQHREVSGTVAAGPEPSWRLAEADPPMGVPCQRASVIGDFVWGQTPIPTEQLAADCSGSAFVRFGPGVLEGAFAARAGLDPRARDFVIAGTLQLRSDEAALEAALSALAAVNEGATDRAMPLWSAVSPALGDIAAPFSEEVQVGPLTVMDADTRPWTAIVMVGVAFGALLGAVLFVLLQKLHAERALRRRWRDSVGHDDDPLRQRPLAVVLAEAEADVHVGRIPRIGMGLLVAIFGAYIGAQAMLQLFLVSLD